MTPELSAGLDQTALGLMRPDRSSNMLLKLTLKGRQWRILEKTNKDSRSGNHGDCSPASHRGLSFYALTDVGQS